MKKALMIVLGVVIAIAGAYSLQAGSGRAGKDGATLAGHGDKTGSVTPPPPKVAHLFESPLMAYLPADAVGFGVCDHRLPGAARLRNSALFELFGKWFRDPARVEKVLLDLSALSPMQEEEAAKFRAAVSTARKWHEAILEEVNRSGDLKTEDLLFFSSEPKEKQPFRFAMLSRMSGSYDPAPFAAKLTTLGLTIREEQSAGMKLYVWDVIEQLKKIGDIAEIPADDQKFLPQLGLFIGYKDNLVAMSTDRPDVERLLAPPPAQSTPPAALQSDYLKSLRQVIEFDPAENYCLSYTDYRRTILGTSKSLSSLEPGTDPATQQQVAQLMEGFPILGELQASGFYEGATSRVGIMFQLKSSLFDLTSWIDPLAKTGPVTVTSAMPDNALSAFVVGLQGLTDYKSQILNAVGLSPESPPNPMFEEFFNLGADITEIGFYGAFIPGEEVFPEGTVILASKRPQVTADFIKAAPQRFFPEQSGQLGSWVDKTIEGAKCSFLASPIGVGAFMTSTDSLVIVSTSEVGIGRAIQAVNGKTKKLSDVLSSSKLLRAGSNSLLFGYLDFAEMMKVFEGLKQSYAQYTGDIPELPQEVRELITVLGKVGFRLNVRNEILEMEFRQKEQRLGTTAAVKSEGSAAKCSDPNATECSL